MGIRDISKISFPAATVNVSLPGAKAPTTPFARLTEKFRPSPYEARLLQSKAASRVPVLVNWKSGYELAVAVKNREVEATIRENRKITWSGVFWVSTIPL